MKRLAKTAEIRTYLKRRGPLYCRAAIRAGAESAYECAQTSPWYVCHVDGDQLRDDVLQQLINEFGRGPGKDVAAVEYLDCFATFLEEAKGYIVLHSGPEGYCALSIPEQED